MQSKLILILYFSPVEKLEIQALPFKKLQRLQPSFSMSFGIKTQGFLGGNLEGAKISFRFLDLFGAQNTLSLGNNSLIVSLLFRIIKFCFKMRFNEGILDCVPKLKENNVY